MKRVHIFAELCVAVAALGGALLSGPVFAQNTYTLGWGLNADSQASPVITNVISNVTALAAGSFHSLAVKDGRTWAWGNNAYGQTNVPIAAQSGVAQVAGGASFSLALKTNGSVISWGDGVIVSNMPGSLGSGVTQISAGEWHALALKDGGVVAWGSNTYGQCTVPDSLTSGVAAVSGGGFYSLALKDGGVQVFGIQATNSEAYDIRSIPAAATSGVSAISAGRWHALALKDGGVIAWGATNFFEATNYLPAQVTSGVAAISAGDLFSMALKTNGTLVVWGNVDTNNAYGQVPIPNYASNGVVKIAAGKGHCLVACSALPPRFVDSRTLPDGYQGHPYSNGYVQAVGDPAVHYLFYGTKPGWMTLDETTGAIGGTPDALNTYNFMVIATNAIGRVTNSYQVTINEMPLGAPVFLTTNPLPNGVVGAPYVQQIVITNGGTFSLVAGEGELPSGLNMDTNGLITGTPTAAEAKFFTVRATNLVGASNRIYNLTIDAPAGPPVFITPDPLPDGIVGQPYSVQIVVSNYPTDMGLVSGAFPLGLGMTSAGLVTGTPAQVESANFTVYATNMAGASNGTYNLQIYGPPVFATDSPLPNGSIGVPYSQQIVATGDALFSQVAGSLPDGLGLTAAGMVTGTPTVAGPFNFTVRATNDYGWSNRVFDLTIDISAVPPVFLTTSPLSDGVLGMAYFQQIMASGSPIFSLDSGSLPGGLSLATNGWVTGTPTNTGAFNFTVRATNDYGWSNRTFSLQIFGPPEFATASPLPTGVVGTAYSQQIDASGSPTFSLVGGSLPGGLNLSGAGLLNGTPTNAGAFNFTVRATNDYGWSNRVFDLAVNARTLAVLNRSSVNVRENGEGRFFVKLDELPAVNTTVTVARADGDVDVAVQSGAQLIFTPANWNTWQLTTLVATNDADATNGTATIRVTAPGGATNIVATELDDDIGANIALASAGSTISGIKAGKADEAIDGIHLVSTNAAYTTWTNVPPGTLTLDLNATATVSRIRVLSYDWDARVHRYQIESSPDNSTWTLCADASTGEHSGWEDWAVADASIRYLRFTGLSNTLSTIVRLNEWEVYGTVAGQLPPSFTSRPYYTNGNVRLTWTNPNAGGSVQVWHSTNITRVPPPWTNLGVQVSPWTNVAPPVPSYYRLILVP